MAGRGSKKRFWTEGLGSVGVAILAALFLRWLVLEAFVIPSSSMAPTLYTNDYLFVNKIVFGLRWPFTEKWLLEWGGPSRGDVTIFKYPGQGSSFYIKRIVGLPGDRIFYENGHLYVNDRFIDQRAPTLQEVVENANWLRDEDFPGESGQGGKDNYIHYQETLDDQAYSVLSRKEKPKDENYGPFLVPSGHYFVIGDNRDNSDDSRNWVSDAVKAKGLVEISKSPDSLQDFSKTPLVIPNGTLIRTAEGGRWVVRYRITEDITFSGTPLKVNVEAEEAGPIGNRLSEGGVFEFEGELAKVPLITTQVGTLVGGIDRRFVPRSHLVGRAWVVWLSCERRLPFMSFICDPFSIRWGRIFRPVHHTLK